MVGAAGVVKEGISMCTPQLALIAYESVYFRMNLYNSFFFANRILSEAFSYAAHCFLLGPNERKEPNQFPKRSYGWRFLRSDNLEGSRTHSELRGLVLLGVVSFLVPS